MGKLVAFTNDTKKIIHIGNKTIWPGSTREVDETLLPNFKAPEKVEEPEADPLLDLLDNSIPIIVEAITARDENGAPTITDEGLAKLKAAEEDGNTRKGLMSAIAEEELGRANEKAEGTGGAIEELIASLPDKSEDEVLELSELHKEDEAETAAIDAEIERRSGIEELIASLPDKSDLELTELSVLKKDDEVVKAAIDSEFKRRTNSE